MRKQRQRRESAPARMPGDSPLVDVFSCDVAALGRDIHLWHEDCGDHGEYRGPLLNTVASVASSSYAGDAWVEVRWELGAQVAVRL